MPTSTLLPTSKPKPTPKLGEIPYEVLWEQQANEREASLETTYTQSETIQIIPENQGLSGEGTIAVFNGTSESVQERPASIVNPPNTTTSSDIATQFFGDLQSSVTSSLSETKNLVVDGTKDIFDLFKNIAGADGSNNKKEEKPEEKAKKAAENQWIRARQEAVQATIVGEHQKTEAKAAMVLAGDQVMSMSSAAQNRLLNMSADVQQNFTAYRASELRKALIDSTKTQSSATTINVGGPNTRSLATNQIAQEGQAVTHGVGSNPG